MTTSTLDTSPSPEYVTVSHTNLDEARRLLNGILCEMWRRNDEVVAGRGGDLPTGWTGPKIHLTVNNLAAVVADHTCCELLGKILREGRKLGITGVAYGTGTLTCHQAGDQQNRDFLEAGVVLRYVDTTKDRNQ